MAADVPRKFGHRGTLRSDTSGRSLAVGQRQTEPTCTERWLAGFLASTLHTAELALPLLDWRPATAHDAGALSLFECTTPPRRGYVRRHESRHELPWEFDVQSYIREKRHKCSPGQALWVGTDGDSEIAAVFRLEEIDGPAIVLVSVAAVALRHRHQGGGVADEMLRTCLDEITAAGIAAQLPEVIVVGHIHPENQASQKMARRAGAIHVGMLDDYQVWQKALQLH